MAELIDPENAASLRLVETFGFRCERVLREHLRVREIWRGDMVFALLADELCSRD